MDFLTALTILAPSIVTALTLWYAFRQNRDNNNRQLQQQREQRQHEEKTAQIEAEMKQKIAELETQERLKVTLREVYANSAKYLAEVHGYLQVKQETELLKEDELKMHIAMAEANHWLTMLAIHHYSKNNDIFLKFSDNILELATKDNAVFVRDLRDNVLKFAANDPRLK